MNQPPKTYQKIVFILNSNMSQNTLSKSYRIYSITILIDLIVAPPTLQFVLLAQDNVLLNCRILTSPVVTTDQWMVQ